MTILSTETAQRGLIAQGFDPGPVDGIYGPATAAAFSAWKEYLPTAHPIPEFQISILPTDRGRSVSVQPSEAAEILLEAAAPPRTSPTPEPRSGTILPAAGATSRSPNEGSSILIAYSVLGVTFIAIGLGVRKLKKVRHSSGSDSDSDETQNFPMTRINFPSTRTSFPLDSVSPVTSER